MKSAPSFGRPLLGAALGAMHLVGGSLLGASLLAAALRCYGVGSPATRG
jgi:hypothetical protein